MANWTNANEAGKTSFVEQRESPLSGGSRGGWERVYVRETMRKQRVGGGGQIFHASLKVAVGRLSP